MTCSNYRKITFLLQKKDSKASEGWQDDEGVVTGKWEMGHVSVPWIAPDGDANASYPAYQIT
jgi:hypothetical protein